MLISDKTEFVEFDGNCMCASWADFHALCNKTPLSMLLCKTKCVPIVFRSWHRNSN